MHTLLQKRVAQSTNIPGHTDTFEIPSPCLNSSLRNVISMHGLQSASVGGTANCELNYQYWGIVSKR